MAATYLRLKHNTLEGNYNVLRIAWFWSRDVCKAWC